MTLHQLIETMPQRMCATMKAKACPMKYSSVQLLLTGQCIYIRYYANKKSKKEGKVGYCAVLKQLK